MAAEGEQKASRALKEAADVIQVGVLINWLNTTFGTYSFKYLGQPGCPPVASFASFEQYCRRAQQHHRISCSSRDVRVSRINIRFTEKDLEFGCSSAT